MKSSSSKKQSLRIIELDIIRGFAVLTMIAAHTVAFLYDGNNNIPFLIQYFGDTVSFTIFLLVSGAATYIAYINISSKKWQIKKTRLLKRLIFLLLGYYIVAFISTIDKSTISNAGNQVTEILIFKNIPGYTEFIIPFIAYGLLVLLFRETFKKLTKSPALVVIVAIISYVLGFFLYHTNTPRSIIAVKSILAGSEGLYRFPILQYLSIFLLGMLGGRYLQRARKFLNQSITNFLFIILTISMITIIIPQIAKLPYESPFQRWPPSIGFLIIGVTFATAFFVAINFLKQKLKKTFPGKVLNWWGVFAFNMYIFHLIILQIFNHIVNGNFKISNPYLILPAIIFTLCLTSFIIFLAKRKTYCKIFK